MSSFSTGYKDFDRTLSVARPLKTETDVLHEQRA